MVEETKHYVKEGEFVILLFPYLLKRDKLIILN